MAQRKSLPASDRLLTPAETAEILQVETKTLTRWIEKGWLSAIRTPGGHRRYHEAEVRAFAKELGVRL